MKLGKVPPHDVEAEQAVIGSMLTDKDSVISAVETLKDEDFYREDNKVIYGAIMNLYNRGEPVDIITLKDELVSLGKFEAVGGLEYLAELPEKVPTTANVDKYIKIVEEKSMLRTLIKTANELIVLGYDQTQEVEDIMDVAEKKIFNVMQRKNQKGYSSMKDILVESFTQLEELYNDVGWSAYTQDLEVLKQAILQSLDVITVWNDDKLVGLIRAIGDGLTIVYIQDILVLNAYQNKGIASELLQRILNKYKNVRQKVLLTEEASGVRYFYEKNGFESCDQGLLVAFAKMN